MEARSILLIMMLVTGTVAAPLAASGAVSFDAESISVQTTDPVAAGRSLFSTACSRCHGADGVGGGTGGRYLR